MSVDEGEGFRAVFEAVVHSRRPGVDERGLEGALELARLNKVLLQFLRVAGVDGELRSAEEARYRRFLEGLRLVADALEDLDHAFIKLRKPVTYVPSDVDVLVAREHLPLAVSGLRGRGFGVEVVEPYCVTVTRGGLIVDLYVHPTLGGVIYLDGPRLLELREPVWFGGVEIPALETHAEALTAAAHAIYKERAYTLNDYATVSRWCDGRTLRLAEELNCLPAVREALRIHELVAEGRLTLPHRIPQPMWLRLLGSKAARDRLTRGTLLGALKTLRDPRFGRLVLSKLTKETY